MDLIGKAGGTPDFSSYSPGGVSVGAWLTAVISFVIMATIVYFFIVLPYTKAKERYFPAEEPAPPPTWPCSRRSATCCARATARSDPRTAPGQPWCGGTWSRYQRSPSACPCAPSPKTASSRRRRTQSGSDSSSEGDPSPTSSVAAALRGRPRSRPPRPRRAGRRQRRAPASRAHAGDGLLGGRRLRGEGSSVGEASSVGDSLGVSSGCAVSDGVSARDAPCPRPAPRSRSPAARP